MRTFQRGAERLSLHVREGSRGITLVVSGNDDLRSYSFHDARAMMKFEAEMEEFLLYAGWRPMKFTPEPVAEPPAAAIAAPPERRGDDKPRTEPVRPFKTH